MEDPLSITMNQRFHNVEENKISMRFRHYKNKNAETKNWENLSFQIYIGDWRQNSTSSRVD